MKAKPMKFDGKIRFLTDCTHEWKGQTLDLMHVDS